MKREEARTLDAKCIKCGLFWNVSSLMKIGKSGYVCPHCSDITAGRKDQRKNDKEVAGPPREKGTKGRRKRDLKRERNARRYA